MLIIVELKIHDMHHMFISVYIFQIITPALPAAATATAILLGCHCAGCNCAGCHCAACAAATDTATGCALSKRFNNRQMDLMSPATRYESQGQQYQC